MKKRNQKTIRFGISFKMSLAIGFIGVLVALISFLIATRLYKVLTVSVVLDKNWNIADNLMDENGRKNMASLLIQEKEIYDSLTEGESVDPADETYQSLYDGLKTPEYDSICEKLRQSANIPLVMWADLRFKDEARGRYVYLMHTDAEDDGTYGIGYWEDDDDLVNSALVAHAGDDPDAGEMYFLPEWVADVADKLPSSINYVPYIIDHLLYIDSRNISDRFSVLYPIRHPDTGALAGYLCIGEYYSNYQTYSWAYAFVFLSVFIPWFVIVILVARKIINRRISAPINRLALAAIEYGEDEDKQSNNDHFKHIGIPSQDEVLILRDSMAGMEEGLIRYMDHLKEMTARQERFNTEMYLSVRVQMGMLPRASEFDTGKRGFKVSAFIKPARIVGGDFYDFFEIDDDRIGIVMADVSGKGMPAALFMMIAKLIIGSAARKGASEEDIMRRTNVQVCANNPEMMFVTIFLGIYHIKQRTLRYVNAGHEYPALYRQDEGRFKLIEADNDLPVGFDPNVEYTVHSIDLKPGDKLFLYTDGIPEANDPEGEMYGNERMLSALTRSAGLAGDMFLKAVSEEVGSFMGETEQFDDMTMLLMEINKPE